MFCLGPFSVYCYQLVGVVTHVFSRFRREAISCVPLRQGKKQKTKWQTIFFLKKNKRRKSNIFWMSKKKKNRVFYPFSPICLTHDFRFSICMRNRSICAEDLSSKLDVTWYGKKQNKKKSLRKWKGKNQNRKKQKGRPFKNRTWSIACQTPCCLGVIQYSMHT